MTISFVFNLEIKMAKTLIPPNIWAARQAIEVDFDTSRTPDRVGFHHEK
jgi:hypothetical protein